MISDIDSNRQLTIADNIAARLLIYQSLDYSSRNKVDETLFSSEEKTTEIVPAFYDQLSKLTESQYSYLIRMAIAGKADSKFPYNDSGKILYKVAEDAGVDVAAIAKIQSEKSEQREEKLQKRIDELEKKIRKLETAQI